MSPLTTNSSQSTTFAWKSSSSILDVTVIVKEWTCGQFIKSVDLPEEYENTKFHNFFKVVTCCIICHLWYSHFTNSGPPDLMQDHQILKTGGPMVHYRKTYNFLPWSTIWCVLLLCCLHSKNHIFWGVVLTSCACLGYRTWHRSKTKL